MRMCLLITDGDADRCGIGDENGEFINQLRVYALLALYLLEIRGERGAIVKTLSTTTMLNKLGKLYDVPVYETGVGFKYVAPKMMETDAMIGGEESGGYAFRGNVPERDGILANLVFPRFYGADRARNPLNYSRCSLIKLVSISMTALTHRFQAIARAASR